jgi:UDP-N-acetylglucosamine--N-acetylmuramyl-(pentapeptide) pyrophosphoryl-undecaprenol N-acetylglucosamine transferase
MPPDAPTTFIFAGGGSGGHIYPGLAIAEELARLAAERGGPAPGVLFIISERPLDENILRPTGHRYLRAPAQPLYRSLKGLARFSLGWNRARRQAKRELAALQSRGPVHIVAMGGFVAGPVVKVARDRRLPVTMVNLDAVPGKANRWIARRAGRILTAAPVPPEHRAGAAEWEAIPPIVRAAARAQRSQGECRAALGLDPSRPVLMVTGGSQGLRSLNDFVTAFAASPNGRRALTEGRWQVLHQTGRNLDGPAAAAYAAAGIDARVVPFSDQMGLWWGAADIAVGTAGAGNVAEAWMNAVPALLLPYPHHRDQHQKFNAAALVAAGGVLLGTDRIDPALNLETNAPALLGLVQDRSRREAMRAALRALGPADGATRVARALLDAPAAAPARS